MHRSATMPRSSQTQTKDREPAPEMKEESPRCSMYDPGATGIWHALHFVFLAPQGVALKSGEKWRPILRLPDNFP